MQLATWNVNSLKMRLPHVLRWLEETQTDILCLQELKMTDEVFPVMELEAAGYGSLFAGQKTYNGVAILYRRDTVKAAGAPIINIPDFEDEQKRLITSSFETAAGPLRVVCGYFPNGAEVGCEKYVYKLRWLAALNDFVKEELSSHDSLALLGDFNIAPEDRDVWNPAAWVGCNIVSPKERAAFSSLLALGLHDSFRLFDQPEGLYTWWDYRMLGFPKNHGLRIDHILVSDALKEKIASCTIDRAPRKWTKPSDHTPFSVTIAQ